MVGRDVIAQRSRDFRVVPEIELNVDRSVYDRSCDVMRGTVDLAGRVKQYRIVPFRLKVNSINIRNKAVFRKSNLAVVRIFEKREDKFAICAITSQIVNRNLGSR